MKRRTLSLAAIATLAVAALTTMGISAPATAALNGHDTHAVQTSRSGPNITPLRGHQIRPQLKTTLSWNGGPVEHSAKVYLDFYGSQWNSDPNGVANYLTNFFNGLGADSWSHVLTQYYDSSAYVSLHNPVLGGVWFHNTVSSPTNASYSQLSSEANTAASHFGVSGPSTDVFVVSPKGTHPDGFGSAGFCAWHDWNGRVAFTNMPYVLDLGSSCGANSVRSQLDGFSIVGGHEYAEAANDPEPSSGWVDNSSGEENADLCAWQNLFAKSLSTGTFALQPTWSNAIGGCAQSG